MIDHVRQRSIHPAPRPGRHLTADPVRPGGQGTRATTAVPRTVGSFHNLRYSVSWRHLGLIRPTERAMAPPRSGSGPQMAASAANAAADPPPAVVPADLCKLAGASGTTLPGRAPCASGASTRSLTSQWGVSSRCPLPRCFPRACRRFPPLLLFLLVVGYAAGETPTTSEALPARAVAAVAANGVSMAPAEEQNVARVVAAVCPGEHLGGQNDTGNAKNRDTTITIAKGQQPGPYYHGMDGGPVCRWSPQPNSLAMQSTCHTVLRKRWRCSPTRCRRRPIGVRVPCGYQMRFWPERQGG